MRSFGMPSRRETDEEPFRGSEGYFRSRGNDDRRGRCRLKCLNARDSLHYNPITHFHAVPFEGLCNKLAALIEKEEKRADGYAAAKESKKHQKKFKQKTGDEKVRDLKYWLDNIGIVRHDFQIRFHDAMIVACLKKLYELEWATQYDQILLKYNVLKHVAELLIMCPRRFGKTYSVSSFAACYLWTIPKCEIAIYSTGRRAAKKLMMLALSFLLTIPGFRDKIETKNQEELVLDFGNGDTRKLMCYPSSVAVCCLYFYRCFSRVFFTSDGEGLHKRDLKKRALFPERTTLVYSSLYAVR